MTQIYNEASSLYVNIEICDIVLLLAAQESGWSFSTIESCYQIMQIILVYFELLQ